jgi:nitrite reductase/ring-hydroxylating ferredoxin subunit
MVVTMAIEHICPHCKFPNLLLIDQLMGKYAICSRCRSLFKIINGDRPTRSGDEPEKAT